MSNSFNAVLTCGRDSEVRTLPSGQEVLTVTAANTVGYGDRRKTVWFRVSLFRKNASALAQYLTKGSQFFCSGELSEHEYQAKDGTTARSLEINASVLDLVGGKREAAPQAAKPQAPLAAEDDLDSADIPF